MMGNKNNQAQGTIEIDEKTTITWGYKGDGKGKWFDYGDNTGGWSTTSQNGNVTQLKVHNYDDNEGTHTISGWDYNKDTGETEKFSKSGKKR